MKHMYREQLTPNADIERQDQNINLVSNNSKEGMRKYTELLNKVKTVRKNAVHAVEFVVTGSPEKIKTMTTDEQNKYLKESMDWLSEKVGGKQNIIAASIHKDETTPHLSFIAVPITKEDKLSYKQFFGGHRDQLKNLQTDFAKEVASKYGLERGMINSKARHQTLKQYYKYLNEVMGKDFSDGMQRTPFETRKQHFERVVKPMAMKFYAQENDIKWQKDKTSRYENENKTLRDKNKNLNEVVKYSEDYVDTLKDAFKLDEIGEKNIHKLVEASHKMASNEYSKKLDSEELSTKANELTRKTKDRTRKNPSWVYGEHYGQGDLSY